MGVWRALSLLSPHSLLFGEAINFLHFHTQEHKPSVQSLRRSKSMSTGDYKMLRVLCQPAYKREYPHHNPEPFRRDRMFFVLSIPRSLVPSSTRLRCGCCCCCWRDGGCAPFFFSPNGGGGMRSLFFIKPIPCRRLLFAGIFHATIPRNPTKEPITIVMSGIMCRCSAAGLHSCF